MHVIYALEHGGTERFLCRLLNRFAGDSVRHVLCTLRTAGDRTAALDPRIQVIPLALRPRDRWGFIKLARAVRTVDAAIVHARNLSTWTDALLAGRFARRTRLVLGFHGTQSPAGMTAAQRRRFRLLGISNTTVTSVSHAGKRMLVDDLGCAPGQVHVLTNGVDLARFRPADAAARQRARARWRLHEGDIAIGTVGNLFSAVKGHAVLIDAFARIAHELPTACLLIAGFGPLREQLQQQASRLGIANRIQLLGAVDDVENLHHALDLYVCPSLSEGMSNALLEAMACGVPCVATAIADHPRIFAQLSANAQLVPPGDAGALARTTLRLIRAQPERQRLGQRGRRLVEARYAIESAFAGYDRLYRTLLEDAHAVILDHHSGVETASCTT